MLGHSISAVLPGLAGAAAGYFRQRGVEGRLSEQARAGWGELSLRGRWGVRRALRRGRAVDDPRLARVAFEYAASLGEEYGRAWHVAAIRAVAVFLAALTIYCVARGWTGATLLCAAGTVLFGAAAAHVPRQRRLLARAEAANRRLAAPA